MFKKILMIVSLVSIGAFSYELSNTDDCLKTEMAETRE